MTAFTVPFTGQYNTRIAKSNAASATSGIVGIGIVGLFMVGTGAQASDKDERYINCFLTKEGGRDYIVKRPGFAALNTPGAGNVASALWVWAGSGAGTSVISAFGAANSTIYSGTSSLGTITGKANSISETTISGTATLTVPSNDSTGWYYDTGVGTMTKITDGDYPGNAGKTVVGGFAHIDGYACILTSDGYLYASDVNSVTSWTPNSRIAVQSYPGLGVGCVRFKQQIIAFKRDSFQVYVNRGQTPFPLIVQPEQTQKIGAVSADAIAEISDNIFFAGSTPQGGCSIFQYNGQLSRISTPEQDFQLVLAGPANISLTTLRVYGRSFVLVKANTTTYVYCIEDKRWHEWTSTTPLWYKCAGLSTGSQILTYSVSNIATGGKVYIIDPATLVFTDDTVTYTATAQSASDIYGTPNRKTFSDLTLIADQEPATSPLTISASDDDYQTWNVMGAVDLSLPYCKVTRLGSSRQRAWKFTHNANTAMRVQAAMGNMMVSSG